MNRTKEETREEIVRLTAKAFDAELLFALKALYAEAELYERLTTCPLCGERMFMGMPPFQLLPPDPCWTCRPREERQDV